MARRQSGLSARANRTAKSAMHISDRKIDYTDIPESTDQELKRAKRVGRQLSLFVQVVRRIRCRVIDEAGCAGVPQLPHFETR